MSDIFWNSRHVFLAASKPAWIKRFRKPAVCSKNPRSFCLHFPAPFPPPQNSAAVYLFIATMLSCYLYWCNLSIRENAVPFMGGILHSGWIDMLQAGGSLWDWRIEARQACGCLLLSGIVFLRTCGNMKQLWFSAIHPGFPNTQSCHIFLLQENLFFMQNNLAVNF